jgi:hypothetical protein
MVMIVKQKFDLLKGTENVLHLSAAEIKKQSVENGARKIFVVIELMKSRINHYTKNKVFDKISLPSERKYLHVLNLPNYPLPVSYNIPTKGMVININPFGIDDVETTKPGPYNLYALMVYAIVFSEMVSGKIKISEKQSRVIADYFVSVLMRLFGKQYGLLGSFSTEIPKLKFLTNLYILDSFFGIKGPTAYKKAAAASAFNPNEVVDKLPKYDFSNINNLIIALSDFGVMPNLNRHLFAQKLLQFFGVNVIPAFEDCSRFVATLATSDIKGSNVVSTYLSKYNEREFGKILEISKAIFKRK